jgi:hypothetical protein
MRKAIPWSTVFCEDDKGHPLKRHREDWEKVIAGILWVAVLDATKVYSKPIRNGYIKPETYDWMLRKYRSDLASKAQARKWLRETAGGLWHNLKAGVTYERFIAALEEKWKEIGSNKSRATKFLNDVGRVRAT